VVQAVLVLELAGRDDDWQGTLESVLDTDDTIARCQQGDARAFRELFMRHRSEVARLVFRMAGPHVDIEDLVQEVFLQVHRSLKDFRGQAKFATWLHRVAVNVVLMQRRAARCRPQLADFQAEDSHPDSRIGPDEDAERTERLSAFRKLLDQLPEKKRTVFILHEIQGLSPLDISKIVGAPVLTVRTRLFYARKDLASMMRSEPVLAAFAQGFGRTGVKDLEMDKAGGSESSKNAVRTASNFVEGAR
jgi:RNA polymerase sigma-70 factor, ECF subfamily